MDNFNFMLIVLILSSTVSEGSLFASSKTLYKCLKNKSRLDCLHRDSGGLCCKFFKTKRRSRTAKVLQVPDLNFKENFGEIEDQANEIEIDEPVHFKGGQRRGIVINETKEAGQQKESFFAHHDHVLSGSEGYDRGLCAQLRVPCRFVNDHPCCSYEMPLDLVARARALDGSADLKWRPISLGGPRTAAQGRSLFRSLFNQEPPQQPQKGLINRNIKYNFAKSKKKVQIPKYHYDGGPEMTSTIMGLCWRLHYVRCPASNSSGLKAKEWIDANRLKQIHPCCQLLTSPASSSGPVDSRVSRWLRHRPLLV